MRLATPPVMLLPVMSVYGLAVGQPYSTTLMLLVPGVRVTAPVAAMRSLAAGVFKRGMLVRHGKFGLGRVEDLSPAGSETRIVVLFQGGAGRKILMLGVARLERVDS